MCELSGAFVGEATGDGFEVLFESSKSAGVEEGFVEGLVGADALHLFSEGACFVEYAPFAGHFDEAFDGLCALVGE